MKIGTLALAAAMAFTSGTAALAQGDFYRGKQLKIVVGSEAGGGFSSYSLLLSAYLSKNIPGNPAKLTIYSSPCTVSVAFLRFPA